MRNSHKKTRIAPHSATTVTVFFTLRTKLEVPTWKSQMPPQMLLKWISRC